MAQFKKHLFEKLFDMASGYVLDFYNSTFESFIEESVGIKIYQDKYNSYGTSKANHLRCFWDKEEDNVVAKLLKDMLDRYSVTVENDRKSKENDLFELCKKEIETLMTGNNFLTEKLNSVDIPNDLTMRELKTSLENDLNARKFNVALDRLHTYCVKYFRSKSNELSLPIVKDRPLHSIAGEVLKAISIHQSEMTVKILRSSLSVLDNYNKVRNEQSLAHDNEILSNSEAKLIAEWIISLLGYFEECFEIYKLKLNDEELI